MSHNTLKFRVWSKSSKTRVVPHPKDHYLQPWYMISFSGEIMYGDNQGAYVEKRQEDYVIQQCTGLKDSEGKEIWEGDILSYRRKSYSNYVVEYNDRIGAWTASGLPFNTNIGMYVSTCALSVIGNVIENPELISH